MLLWDLCIKSLDYEKDCRGLLRTTLMHAGRIPMDAPEKYREVTQFARGMSCTAHSSKYSNCQSIWLARKQDVFNLGCCWLRCCWFDQICIVLSIQGLTLQHRSMKSHCSLAPLLGMELCVEKSLNSGFNLFRFSTVRGNVELDPTSCTVKHERAATSTELADGCSVWFLAVSVTAFGFYLFEEKRSKCSLILAGGQSSSSRRWEGSPCEGCCCCCCWMETREANIGFCSIEMWQRGFDLDLTLMSPLGTLQCCSSQVDNMGVWIQTKETEEEMFGVGVWGKDMGDRNNKTNKIVENTAIGCRK